MNSWPYVETYLNYMNITFKFKNAPYNTIYKCEYNLGKNPEDVEPLEQKRVSLIGLIHLHIFFLEVTRMTSMVDLLTSADYG